MDRPQVNKIDIQWERVAQRDQVLLGNEYARAYHGRAGE